MVTITTPQAKAIASWLRRVSPQGNDDRRALVAMVELLERKAAAEATRPNTLKSTKGWL